MIHSCEDNIMIEIRRERGCWVVTAKTFYWLAKETGISHYHALASEKGARPSGSISTRSKSFVTRLTVKPVRCSRWRMGRRATRVDKPEKKKK